MLKVRLVLLDPQVRRVPQEPQDLMALQDLLVPQDLLVLKVRLVPMVLLDL